MAPHRLAQNDLVSGNGPTSGSDVTVNHLHYSQLVDKPFFPSISEFMMSGPAVIGIMSGPGVIKSWRDMMGATNPGDATPGTIRGDFATAPDGDMIPNIVHGSDSEESAAREIQIWFGE